MIEWDVGESGIILKKQWNKVAKEHWVNRSWGSEIRIIDNIFAEKFNGHWDTNLVFNFNQAEDETLFLLSGASNI